MNGNGDKKGYKVGFIFADRQQEWNVSEWRSHTPSNALNRAGGGWRGKLIHIQDFSRFQHYIVQDYLMPMDLLVLQRNVIHPDIFNAMRYWQGMGKPCVIDLDDGYHFLPWNNPARAFWFQRPFPVPGDIKAREEGGAIQMLAEGLRLSDGLLSPNKFLLQAWSYITKNSYQLQNYADPGWWGCPPPGAWVDKKHQRFLFRGNDAKLHSSTWYRQNGGPPRGLPPRSQLKAELGQEDKIVIGWGGSMSHYDSFHGSGLLEAIPRVTARHPNIIWTICGAERRLYDQLGQLGVPEVNRYHQPGVPPQLWPRVVARFDIGLAPLAGIYDQCRSWIKGIEYALAGTPFIATQGETYRDLLDWDTGLQGPAGRVFWEDALETILADLPGWQERAEHKLPEARKRFVADENIETYHRVFSQIGTDFNGVGGPLPNIIRISPNGKTKEQAEVKAEPAPAVNA